MINTVGAYILVLVYNGYQEQFGGGGVAMQEFPNYDSCKAAIIQLEPVGTLRGYCIAKEVK